MTSQSSACLCSRTSRCPVHGEEIGDISRAIKQNDWKIPVHTFLCIGMQLSVYLAQTQCRIMDHFKALGCAVSKRATKRKSPSEEEQSELQAVNTCTAVLKIPLNFPKPRSQKKAKKVTF